MFVELRDPQTLNECLREFSVCVYRVMTLVMEQFVCHDMVDKSHKMPMQENIITGEKFNCDIRMR